MDLVGETGVSVRWPSVGKFKNYFATALQELTELQKKERTELKLHQYDVAARRRANAKVSEAHDARICGTEAFVCGRI